MIGFFYVFFLKELVKTNSSNTLRKSIFIGTGFGMSEENIKIHSHEKSSPIDLQTSRTLRRNH